MRIYRYLAGGRVRLGIELDGLLHDMSGLFEQAGERTPEVVERADLRTICAAPDVVVVMLAEYLRSGKVRPADKPDATTCFSFSDVRVLAPIPTPGKIICIGLNYMDHCREQHKEPPPHPMLFAKFANTVCGTGDAVTIPAITQKLDFEGELGVIIGKGGGNIDKARALDHVFGYTAVHDVSARDLQKSDGQWLRAKGCDKFAPMGPCVVTADEIPDPQSLGVRTRLNGQVMQDSNTREMIFPIAELIPFISRAITLEAGDIISTGTPSGVGAHRTPPVFIKPGDVVEVEIEKIGTIRNEFVAPQP